MVTTPKEPYFFCDDFAGLQRETGITSAVKYQQLFEPSSNLKKVRCDASVYYLFSSTAIQKIHRYNPASRLIVMLRNPVTMVHAYHSQLLATGYETERSFEQAWNLQEVRSSGRSVPQSCPDVRLLMYADVASYSPQIERLMRVFPRSQIHFVVFENFISHTEKEFNRILDFLDLSRLDIGPLEPINENKRIRSVKLNRAIGNLSPRVFAAVRYLKRLMGVRASFGQAINAFNIVKEHRLPLKASFQRELVEYFADDVTRVKDITGLELSEWKKE